MTWFSRILPEFSTITLPLAGKVRTYVEVGCWAGDSCEWVMENVRPISGWGIDPYQPNVKQNAEEVEKAMHMAHARMSRFSNWQFHRERSADALRLWEVDRGHRCSIDLFYIDGAHDAASVVIDFTLAWEYLPVGATVIFDDFGIGRRKLHRHVPEAVEAIALAFGDQIDLFHRGPRIAACRVVSKEPPLDPDVARWLERRTGEV